MKNFKDLLISKSNISYMKYFLVIIILALLFFVSGQQGCQIPGHSEAKKTGLDYSLIPGLDYLSPGKLIRQGDTFYVGVKIENYDQEARNGQICIRDDLSDSFGGITSTGECKAFSVKAAEIVSEKTGFSNKKKIKPGSTEVYFPNNGEYSYNNLPSLLKPYSGTLTVSLSYRETTQATTTITVPNEEQPILSQKPAPILISLRKSIHKKQDAYSVDLIISLTKQQKAKIFSPDFNQENRTYFRSEMVPHTLNCFVGSKQISNGGLIEFENEKLIKCSSLVYPTGEESYPFIITLDYGVVIEKNYPFRIETKTQ